MVEELKPNPILFRIKKDWHFIAVVLIALIFVLYSFLGSGTADAVKACNEHWIKEVNKISIPGRSNISLNLYEVVDEANNN